MSKPRNVRLTIEITGPTDRDMWEWGDCIARSLKAEFTHDFGPIEVECVDAYAYKQALSRGRTLRDEDS